VDGRRWEGPQERSCGKSLSLNTALLIGTRFYKILQPSTTYIHAIPSGEYIKTVLRTRLAHHRNLHVWNSHCCHAVKLFQTPAPTCYLLCVARCYAERGYATVRPSFCLSVCDVQECQVCGTGIRAREREVEGRGKGWDGLGPRKALIRLPSTFPSLALAFFQFQHIERSLM